LSVAAQALLNKVVAFLQKGWLCKRLAHFITAHDQFFQFIANLGGISKNDNAIETGVIEFDIFGELIYKGVVHGFFLFLQVVFATQPFIRITHGIQDFSLMAGFGTSVW
jgi:hypothetical protein